MQYCHDCNKLFYDRHGLVEHYLQSPFHHYCQRCDDHFSSLGVLEDHYDSRHHYCRRCQKIFDFGVGLHEHNRQKHFYCISCKRVFDSPNNLDMHLRTSAIHNARSFVCPFQGCGRSFISNADMVLHCESGTCVSGITRNHLNQVVSRFDRQNVITNPARMIAGPSGQNTYRPPQVIDMWATDDAWNGNAYECVLCHRQFGQLKSLNAHLKSPAHAQRIFRCPPGFGGCQKEFRTLSALLQHVQRSTCGVTRFQRQVNAVMDGVTQNAKRLTFR